MPVGCGATQSDCLLDLGDYVDLIATWQLPVDTIFSRVQGSYIALPGEFGATINLINTLQYSKTRSHFLFIKKSAKNNDCIKIIFN